MNSPETEEVPLVINGIIVDRKLLEARSIRRCALSECQAHCCSTGVWLLLEHTKDILAHQAIIAPHLPEEHRNPERWFDWTPLAETDHPAGGTLASTSLVADSIDPSGLRCIFLRPDRKCALQVAGIAAGEHAWRFKPFYCALHPLTFFQGRLTLAEDDPLYFEGGGCHRPSCAEPKPLYQLFETEVKFALGEAGYAELSAVASGSAKPPG
jgi:Fe-S-cluster containining protein